MSEITVLWEKKSKNNCIFNDKMFNLVLSQHCYLILFWSVEFLFSFLFWGTQKQMILRELQLYVHSNNHVLKVHILLKREGQESFPVAFVY